MTSYNLDVESFLDEIRKYPELWDLNCEDYKYRHRRQHAWEHIARIFIDDFDDMPDYEKDDVYKKLHGKWRNLRDSYVRQMRKGNTGKNYAYGKYLSFLENVYKRSGSDAEAETPQQDNSDPDDDKPLKKPKQRRVVKNEASWSVEEDVPSIIQNLTRSGTASTTVKQEETVPNTIEYVDSHFPEVSCSYLTDDDDKSFFDSLLPAVREFDMDQKLEFRSQIICVIKNIRTTKKHNMNVK